MIANPSFEPTPRPPLTTTLALRSLPLPPARAGPDPRPADRGAEQAGELLDDRESLFGADSTAAADDDLRLRQRHPAPGSVDVVRDAHHEIRFIQLGDERFHVDLDRRRL